MDYDTKALELHKRFRGKISISLRDDGEIDKEKLSAYYSPGVAAVSKAIALDQTKLADYTWTNNLVAVISDGSAVLGLGNVGPHGSMPVMEGKSLLFKQFADIDSVPIILDVHSTEEIVATIKAIAPSFGAINLEDIAAPQCFEIEDRLKRELSIPVFHDDQHGTAIVVLAGLLNAAKLTGRSMNELRIVVAGAGAAGTAVTKLLHNYGVGQILAVDSTGIISKSRANLNESKLLLLNHAEGNVDGSLADALHGSDVFIGVSQPGLLTSELVQTMAPNPIIFALANPTPEIMPDAAKAAGAAVIATGRSDLPNQINNALAFPGIFRGALDNKVRTITDEHKLAAARAIADLIDRPDADYIIPSVFDKRLVPAIASVIK